MKNRKQSSKKLEKLLQYALADLKIYSDESWPDRYPNFGLHCGKTDWFIYLTADPKEELWPFEIANAAMFLSKFANDNLNPRKKTTAQCVRIFTDTDGLNLIIRGGYAEADDA